MQELKISTLGPYKKAVIHYLQPILFYKSPFPTSLDVFRKVTKKDVTYFQNYVDQSAVNSLPDNICTYNVTQSSHVVQTLFICQTCQRALHGGKSMIAIINIIILLIR